MRLLKKILLILAVLIVVYFLGPSPKTPDYSTNLPPIPSAVDSIKSYVTTIESKHTIKPDNEARIVWNNDSLKHKTAYSIVYLHGFSASQKEGDPVHRNLAKQFGANLYLARLSGHGIDTSDALLSMTATSLWETAKEAYAIGKQLGDKVILMGTSTGGTLALQLAAAYPDIAGLVLLSPNIAINDPNAWLTNNPWGLQIARLVKGGKMNIVPNKTDEYKRYWNHMYRLEAISELQELLETGMTEDNFKKIHQPLLTLYYYKNEKEQDPVVKVSAMKTMFEQISTPVGQKKMVAIPNAGNHVLGSPIQSKDIVTVEKEAAAFLKEVIIVHRP